MWGGTQQFDFQENTGNMGGGAPREFSFVGQDGGQGPMDAAQLQAEVDAQYQMQAPQYYQGQGYGQPVMAPMSQYPYAYGPPYGPAYGPGGYGAMGQPPAGGPTFVGSMVKGALLGGVVVGALSLVFGGKKKTKKKR